MTKCYYCGKTDGSHDISCICGKSPAMNTPSPTCPHCGTHEIEFLRRCHNSACTSYAQEESTYQGWKGSATSGEAVATYEQRIAADRNFNGVRSKEHMFDYVLSEVLDLRAALAASAEQPNRTSTDHQWDGDGERCTVCGDKDWMAGPKCSEKGSAPVAERATTKGENDERALPAASGGDAPTEHAIEGVSGNAGADAGASQVAERAAAPASVPEDPKDAMLDMLGRVHPFAMPRADNDRAKAYERLERAYVIQQPWPVPDQACIVWRADLMEMDHDLTHKQACFDSDRTKSAAPEVAQPAAQGESIDTPEFWKVVKVWSDIPYGDANNEWQAIIDFIHAWGASQRRAGQLSMTETITTWGENQRKYGESRADAKLVAENCALVEKLRVAEHIEGKVFEKALKQTWEMVDSFTRAHPGSYEKGRQQGLQDALRTIKANFVSALATPAPTAGEPSAEPDGLCNFAPRSE